MEQKVRLPHAILRPEKHERRGELYKVYPNPTPPMPGDQTLLQQLRPFLDGNPVVIDLETEGLEMTGSMGAGRRVTTVSLANHQAVGSWNLLGPGGSKVWRAILELLWKRQTPLIAHNMGFDLAWMLRDLNRREDGSLPRWYHEWRRFNIHACTYALFRQLASEGWAGQKYSLEEAQTQLLLWEEGNKRERQRRLVEAGLLKRCPSHAILLRLFNGDEAMVEEFRRMATETKEEEANDV